MSEEKINFSRQILPAISGTILQWYDFSLFGFFAPVIAKLFFPENSQIASTLYIFGIFAVSFLLAPLGSIFFGYIGDNYGRKKALTISILSMAIPTAMIGLLPSYYQIGILAPILLTILRLIQGFVASAEFTGSAIFLVEHAPKFRSSFFGSLTSSSYSVGLIIGSILSAIATMSFMPQYAWRITFLLSLVGGMLIFYMRRNILETPVFNQQTILNNKNEVSFYTAWKHSRLSIIATFLMAWFIGIITFGTYVFSVTYLVQYANIHLFAAIVIVSAALLLDAMLEPFIAIFADKYGGSKISMIGIAGFTLFSYPLFKLLSSGNIILVTIALLSLSLLIAISCAPINAILILIFPARYRSSGFGVAFNMGIAIFGGTTPLVLSWLISKSGSIIAPSAYYILGSLIGMYAFYLIYLIKETDSNFKNQSLSLLLEAS